MQVVTSGLPAFLIDTSVNMDYPKTPINVNLFHQHVFFFASKIAPSVRHSDTGTASHMP